MAPRRGGSGGAGAEAAAAGTGRNYFEPPPLKRMQPWLQDGSGQCDVLAGGVDESGQFKGIYVSGVHIMALLRTFQLSKVFMPCDVPTPVAALGQSLQDGIPLTVVTRGCFGRDLDYGPGPARNDVKKTIWQTARDMRAEMPQILITCIDIPINLGADMLQACLEPPLNEYRELMYQDGTWYTPSVVNAAFLGKWMAENGRSKPLPKTKGQQFFNRKKFDWQDHTRHYANMWTVSWRPVLEVRAAPEVYRRTDLKFTPEAEKPEVKPIKPSGPSAAEASFKKALTKARDLNDGADIMSAVTTYLKKASAKETESLEEAVKACDEAASLFKAKSADKEAFDAVSTKFKALVSMNNLEEAMKVAEEAKSSAATPVLEAEAIKLIVSCYREQGELDKAVEAATKGKADVAKKSNDEATAEAVSVLVDAHLAKGDVEEAIAAATEATKGKGKIEACGYMLLATALMAKSELAETPAAAKALAKEAADAQKKAAPLFAALQLSKEQADALKAAVDSLVSAEAFSDALAAAKDLEALGAKGAPAAKAAGLEAVATVHLKSLTVDKQYLPGGEEEMVPAARSALAAAEESGDAAAKASAMHVLASALLEGGSVDEAAVMAKKAAVAQKALGGGSKMVGSLITGAKAAMKKGSLHSAYWDAKQALVAAGELGDPSYQEAMQILGQAGRMAEEAGKPVNVGGPVPVYAGDSMTFV